MRKLIYKAQGATSLPKDWILDANGDKIYISDHHIDPDSKEMDGYYYTHDIPNHYLADDYPTDEENRVFVNSEKPRLPGVTVTAYTPETYAKKKSEYNGYNFINLHNYDNPYMDALGTGFMFNSTPNDMKYFNSHNDTKSYSMGKEADATNEKIREGYKTPLYFVPGVGEGLMGYDFTKAIQDGDESKIFLNELGLATLGLTRGVEGIYKISPYFSKSRLSGLSDELKYKFIDFKNYHTYPKGKKGLIPLESLPGEIDDDVFKMIEYSGVSNEKTEALTRLKKHLRDKATKDIKFLDENWLSFSDLDLKDLGLTMSDLKELGRYKDGWGRFGSREYLYKQDPSGNYHKKYGSMVWLLPNMPTRNIVDNYHTVGSYLIGMAPYIADDGTVEPLSRAQLLYLKKGFDAIPKGNYVTADAPGIIPLIIRNKYQYETWRPKDLIDRVFGISNAKEGHVGASFNAYKLLHKLGNKPGNSILYTPGKISKLNNKLTANEPELLEAFNKYESGKMSAEEWVDTFNKWQSEFGGRPAHVDMNGKPRYYWPIIYKGN